MEAIREVLVMKNPYDMYAQILQRAKLLKHSAHYENVRSESKQQRNNLCACGSGLKYKKCCINN